MTYLGGLKELLLLQKEKKENNRFAPAHRKCHFAQGRNIKPFSVILSLFTVSAAGNILRRHITCTQTEGEGGPPKIYANGIGRTHTKEAGRGEDYTRAMARVLMSVELEQQAKVSC